MEKYKNKFCKRHGMITEHVLEKRKYGEYYRCKKCRQERVIKWKKDNRLKAINYLGGKCIICGYNKCIAVLSFHHRDPSIKKFNINNATSKSWKTIKEEIKKCDLLCANCHMELHYGELSESGKEAVC